MAESGGPSRSTQGDLDGCHPSGTQVRDLWRFGQAATRAPSRPPLTQAWVARVGSTPLKAAFDFDGGGLYGERGFSLGQWDRSYTSTGRCT